MGISKNKNHLLKNYFAPVSKPAKVVNVNLDKWEDEQYAKNKVFGPKMRKLTPDGRLFASDGHHGVNVRKPVVYNGKPAKLIDAKYEGKWGWDYLVETKPGVNAWVGDTVKNIKADKKRKS